MTPLAGAKAPKDRDGHLSNHRAFSGQEGMGAGPLAPNLALYAHKVLSYTVAVYFCQQVGLSPLRFAELLTD